jgi:hypothetical protein
MAYCSRRKPSCFLERHCERSEAISTVRKPSTSFIKGAPINLLSQAIGSGMVAALDSVFEFSFSGLADTRAAVPADVVKSSELLFFFPQDDQALTNRLSRVFLIELAGTYFPKGVQQHLFRPPHKAWTLYGHKGNTRNRFDAVSSVSQYIQN